MKISEIMSQDVTVARPQDSLQSVAKQMAAIDAGSIPVCDGERLQGMITDRDIVIRAVSEGRSFETAVSEVMTPDVEYCYDDDDIGATADKMAELQVRRLPVLNRDKRLVGIVALGDIARQAKDRTTGQTLEEISKPSR